MEHRNAEHQNGVVRDSQEDRSVSAKATTPVQSPMSPPRQTWPVTTSPIKSPNAPTAPNAHSRQAVTVPQSLPFDLRTSQMRTLSVPQPQIARQYIPRTLSLSEQQDKRRLESLLDRNLIEEFTEDESRRFLQETKVAYFKNMDVQAKDIKRALDIVFGEHHPCSTEGDWEQCAQDLRRDFEEHMWGSEWFLNYVSPHLSLLSSS